MSKWFRYIVPTNKQRHIIVSPVVHAIVKQYARANEITMSEAVYRLLEPGCIREGLEIENRK